MADQPSNKPPHRAAESLTEATLALLRELARNDGTQAAAQQPAESTRYVDRVPLRASEPARIPEPRPVAEPAPVSRPAPPEPSRPPERPVRGHDADAAAKPDAPITLRSTPAARMTEPAPRDLPRAPQLRPAEHVAARPPAEPQPPASQLRAAAPIARAAARPPLEPPPPAPPPVLAPPPLSDSMRGAAIAGWTIIVLFFGVLGTWAMTAPLHGAVVANGFVKVEGNRRAVQHLEGGIVKELRVKEGVKVAAGDVLIVLDETQAQTEYDVLSRQALILRATEARLTAELIDGKTPVVPETFKSAGGDVIEIWNAQLRQFESRRAALEGQRLVIKEKIAQLEHQIVGGQAQVKSYQAQRTSVVDEMESLAPLVKQGLIARPRYLQLERSGIALEGQIADAIASIARSRQAIAEQQQQIAQLVNDRMTEVTRDLRDTQAKLLEVIPRMMNAQAILGRLEIRAPNSGRVVGLTVFTVGAVVAKGEKIMEVVPDQDSLVIEAQIAVENISDVRPNARAEIHLTAYQQRIVPVVHGVVLQISADRLTEQRTGQAYYTALVSVDETELAALPNVHLYPGMPATVMIPTVERTAFYYLVGPLVMSFNQSFRQR
jgi:epimerase transport system membrane fusion protein